MSNQQKHPNTALIAVAVPLTLICTIGGVLLLSGWQPASNQTDSASHSPQDTVTTATTAPQTTVSSAELKSESTPVTTAPPDPHALYYAYLENELLPEAGSADTSGAVPCSAHCGIAGVFFDDLRDTGTDDMVVIRLDAAGSSSAALPVLLWYGETDRKVTLLDPFEVKPQWSAYCIRRAGRDLFLSGEYLGENADAEACRFTEIQLTFQPEPDLTMLNMEIGTALERPAPFYPESAELLLEMQLDTAQPIAPLTDRRYLLRNYTDKQAAKILDALTS